MTSASLAPDELEDDAVALRAALDVLWYGADLSYLLRPYQLEVRDLVHRSSQRTVFQLSSRRIGKTWNACVLAIEAALRTPFARVAFAFPQQKMARNIIVPQMLEVLEDCPKDIAPVFHKTELTFKFPHNNSTIVLSGCDDRRAADSLRGLKLDFGIIDEAGFHEHLDYVLKSVLLPQTLTTNGKILLISSPPTSPAHSSVGIYTRAVEQGAAVKHTIEVAVPWLERGWDTVKEYVDEAGGPESTSARREYYAEIVTDETMSVIPEFQKVRDEIIEIIDPPPDYRDLYVSADFGFNDLTAVLFGYYHFQRAHVVIEDEIIVHRHSALQVADLIRQKEAVLWSARTKEPFRFADAPPQMLVDIANYGRVGFGPVMKDDKDAAINNLRQLITRKKLRIHPRCKGLLAHIEYAVWNKTKTKFDRSDNHGHYDALDALIYFVRHVSVNSNPEPLLPAGVSWETHHLPQHLTEGSTGNRLLDAFKPMRFRR